MNSRDSSPNRPLPAVPSTAPDSNTDLSAWAFSDETESAVVKAQPKLIAELDRERNELRLSDNPESSFSVLADKLRPYLGKTVKIEPRGIVKGAEGIDLTLRKDGALREVEATSLKVHVTDTGLVVKSIMALVGGKSSEIYNEKKLRQKKST